MVIGFSLSWPWLVLARLPLLFTQVVAIATNFAPERRPDAPVQRQDPRSTMNKAGVTFPAIDLMHFSGNLSSYIRFWLLAE
jgi:hypothetical protein